MSNETATVTLETLNVAATADQSDIASITPELSKKQIARINRNIADSKNDIEAAREIHRVFLGEFAYFGGHMWALNENNTWKIVSNYMKHYLLSTFKEFRGQHFKSLCLDARVDLLNEESPRYYYTRPRGEEYKLWKPLDGINPSDVVFRNGKFDLATCVFTPWPAGQLIFGLLLGHDFDPDLLAKLRAGDYTGAPPEFVTLMDSVNYALSNSAQVVEYFRQVVAQVLRPHVLFPFFVHVIGESGARKTTIMRALLTAPCGAAAVNEISEAVLADRHWAKAGLINRIANLSNDSDRSERFVTFVKEYTSGTIQTERKFQDAEQTRVTAKLFATLNEPQILSDASRGVENRLIAFRFQCREHENDRSAAGTRWMDPDTYSDAARAWITHWLLVGLQNTYTGGVEHVPTAPAEAVAWREEMLQAGDPVRRFVAERLEFAPDEEAKAYELEQAALAGYTSAGSLAGFLGALGRYIKARHPQVEKRREESGDGDDRKRWTVWRGVRVK